MSVTSQSLPTPAAFLRAGWSLARHDPTLFVGRLVSDLANLAVRLGTALVVGSIVAAHLSSHVRGGGSVLSWIDAVVQRFTRPSVLAAFGGLLLAGWALTFVIRCVVDAGIWGVLGDAARGARVVKLRSMVARMTDGFARAVAVRALTTCTDVTLVAVTLGCLAGGASVALWAGSQTGSSLVVPAIVLAMTNTMLISAVVLLRLTAEFVAAPAFLDDASLGEALLTAAAAVVERPVFLYRLFIVAASVLIAPLFVYWAVLMFGNLAYDVPGVGPVLFVARFVAQGLVLAGIAGFVVMLHATFFAYHAWSRGYLLMNQDRKAGKVARPPTLDVLLPKEYPHVVPVDEIMGEWPPDSILPAPRDRSVEDDAPFDLGAILDPTDKPGEDE